MTLQRFFDVLDEERDLGLDYFTVAIEQFLRRYSLHDESLCTVKRTIAAVWEHRQVFFLKMGRFLLNRAVVKEP